MISSLVDESWNKTLWRIDDWLAGERGDLQWLASHAKSVILITGATACLVGAFEHFNPFPQALWDWLSWLKPICFNGIGAPPVPVTSVRTVPPVRHSGTGTWSTVSLMVKPSGTCHRRAASNHREKLCRWEFASWWLFLVGEFTILVGELTISQWIHKWLF